jgi:hypothetical protein
MTICVKNTAMVTIYSSDHCRKTPISAIDIHSDSKLSPWIDMKRILRFVRCCWLGALTNGIGRVSDDDIEAVDLVLKESESVSDVDLDLGVLESSSHGGQVLLGNTDDSLIIMPNCPLREKSCVSSRRNK